MPKRIVISKLGGPDVLKYEEVGLYGLRFFWKDGHHDGIYTFQLLKTLADEQK